MSEILPDINAGPILLNSNPEKFSFVQTVFLEV